MPFALTAMAVVGRIRVLVAAVMVDVVVVYNALVEVAPALPGGGVILLEKDLQPPGTVDVVLE